MMYYLNEIASDLYHSLKRYRVRALVTVFGVFWGQFILIVMLGAGNGLQSGFATTFDNKLDHMIYIEPGETRYEFSGFNRGRQIQLDRTDVQRIKDTSNCIKQVAYETPGPGNTLVSVQDRRGNFDIVGVPGEYFSVRRDVSIIEGGGFTAKAGKSVFIGEGVKRLLFGDAVALGEYVDIAGINFLVQAVVSDSGQNGAYQNRIYLHDDVFRAVFKNTDNLSRIYVHHANDCDESTLVNKIQHKLKTFHRIRMDDPTAVVMSSSGQAAKRLNQTFNYIKIFIWIIGLGTLIAGCVSLSNIMLVTIKEKSVEIGVKKALGCPNWIILSTVLIECFLLSLFGAVLGVVLGKGALLVVTPAILWFNGDITYFSHPYVPDALIGLSSLALLFFAGISALMPAIRAVRTSPVLAMNSK